MKKNTLMYLLAPFVTFFCLPQIVFGQNQYFPSKRNSNIQIVYNRKNIEIRNMDSGESLVTCKDFLRDIKFSNYLNFCTDNQFNRIVVNWNEDRGSAWSYGYVFLQDRSGRSIHAIVTTNGVKAKVTFNSVPGVAGDDYPVDIQWGPYELLLQFAFSGTGAIHYFVPDDSYYDVFFAAETYAREVLKIHLQSELFYWGLYGSDRKIFWTIKGLDLNNRRRCYQGIMVFSLSSVSFKKFDSECNH